MRNLDPCTELMPGHGVSAAATAQVAESEVLIPNKDSQRPIETDGNKAGADVWDAAGDGLLGEDEENSDMEEDRKDFNGTFDDTGNAARQKLEGTRHSIPSWIDEPFERLLQESENCDHLPPLYSIHKTFYFPSSSTFFLLDTLTPSPPSLQPTIIFVGPRAIVHQRYSLPVMQRTPRPSHNNFASTTSHHIGLSYLVNRLWIPLSRMYQSC